MISVSYIFCLSNYFQYMYTLKILQLLDKVDVTIGADYTKEKLVIHTWHFSFCANTV